MGGLTWDMEPHQEGPMSLWVSLRVKAWVEQSNYQHLVKPVALECVQQTTSKEKLFVSVLKIVTSFVIAMPSTIISLATAASASPWIQTPIRPVFGKWKVMTAGT
ncbi:Tripartite Motif-Containing Protein 49C [Manis pentadactyla]|nr:Tripartite Motif-Containing Protein 49C [Manis pentadactyla]